MRNKNYEPILSCAEKVLRRMRADLERPVESLDAKAVNGQVRNLEALKGLIKQARIDELPWNGQTEMTDEVEIVMGLAKGHTHSAYQVQRKLSS